MRPTLLAVALALGAVGAAHAQDDRDCRNGAFPREQDAFGLARVRGPGRLPFLSDSGGCPETGRPCAGGGYVVPGDRVITGRSLGAYVCAFFPNAGGGSAGWVARDRLSPEPAPVAPAAATWVGRWRNGDDGIRLTLRRDGSLRADGGAYWPSAHPPESLRPSGPNVGELAGQGRPEGARLHLGDDACIADLQLVGPYLVVRDNMGCGGMNVTFTGVYRR